MVDIKIEGNTVFTIVDKELTNEDYKTLIPELESLTDTYTKINWYFEMNNFKGWEPGAFVKDLKFDLAHTRDFEKIAMVGDKKWEQWLTNLMKPFTTATVRYFELENKEQARQWIKNPGLSL